MAIVSAKEFTNGWSVKISSSDEVEARRVAKEINSIMKGERDSISVTTECEMITGQREFKQYFWSTVGQGLLDQRLLQNVLIFSLV